MATKKFIIEVEDNPTKCKVCEFYTYEAPCPNIFGRGAILDCAKYDLATMKIKELEEEQ